MPVRSLIKPKLYKDSVSLMRIAEAIGRLPGVRRATLLMGTEANKGILAGSGLLRPEVGAAGPNDIMAVIDAEGDEALAGALAAMEGMLSGEAAVRTGESHERPPHSIGVALSRIGTADLALISVPGPYAGAEAMKALRQGLNVFLFSDNIPVEQELAAKRLARRKGLLVMGPDCGTAILNGVPLGFANVVRPGRIGLVAASGTGLQEVTCRIDRLGEGISQAIGTGGRDVSEAIGGITMLRGLDLLAADDATEVIVIVSKPPAPAVAERILERAATAGKPVVALFLGGDGRLPGHAPTLTPVETLEAAADAAVALARGESPQTAGNDAQPSAPPATGRLAPSQRYLRGLYSGGTFCSEAQLIWRARGLTILSNVPVAGGDALAGDQPSRGHTALDLGSDEFTVGRPHPMIDYATRVERLLREAADPETAAIVLDIVLGYGSHPDPASVLAPAIAEARGLAERAGRSLSVVGFVCGTAGDPQDLAAQEAKLREAGVTLAQSSTAAARLAAAIVADAAGRGAAPAGASPAKASAAPARR